MAFISILSDWNRRDHYAAMARASLMQACPGCVVVDISHEVSSFNIMQAAFILANVWESFPTGSVHLCYVNSEPSVADGHLACEYKGHYFIAADNGLFSLAFGQVPQTTVRLASSPESAASFASLQVFSQAAASLLKGNALESLGKPAGDIRTNTLMLPAIDKNKVDGHVMYVDSYGNGITNIHRQQFEQQCAGRHYELLVQSNHNRISVISSRYSDVQPGDLLALFNQAGYLEIAINQGNAAQLLNLGINAQVRIKFTDHKTTAPVPQAGKLF